MPAATGVLSDAKAIAETVRRVSPDTLIVLDGVCAVASEEIRMDDWQIDVVVGASQKGISVPPGVSITALSQKALQVLDARKTPIPAYFANYKRWLPVMESYEKGTPAYFATPSVNLIYALEASLKTIVDGPVSLEDRFKMHREAAAKFRDEVRTPAHWTIFCFARESFAEFSADSSSRTPVNPYRLPSSASRPSRLRQKVLRTA